jgi:AAA domain
MAMAKPTTSLLSQFKPASQLNLGVKIQIHGASQAGKSHDVYEAAHKLGLRMKVIDSDTSSDKFPQFGDPDAKPLFAISDVIGFYEEVIYHAEQGNKVCDLILTDSLSNILDAEIRRRGIDVSKEGMDGQAKTAQADWARDARYLNLLVRMASALSIHTVVTAETRTRYTGNRIDTNNAYEQSALSPRKFRYPFDVIIKKNGRDLVAIEKSRYEGWDEGTIVKGWGAQMLMDVLSGKRKKKVGMSDFNPATEIHEELMNLLIKLGTKAKNGVLEVPEAMRLKKVAHSDCTPEAAGDEIKKLRATFAAQIEKIERMEAEREAAVEAALEAAATEEAPALQVA